MGDGPRLRQASKESEQKQTCGVQKHNEVTVPRTQESSAPLTQNFPDGFSKGEMRLVKLGLFSGYGAAVKSAGTLELSYSLYKQGDWVSLVTELPGRMGDDGHYFLLGIAAEKLGYLKAAYTYYGLSIDMSKRPMISKCISTCFGHKFPEDAILRRSRLDIN